MGAPWLVYTHGDLGIGMFPAFPKSHGKLVVDAGTKFWDLRKRPVGKPASSVYLRVTLGVWIYVTISVLAWRWKRGSFKVGLTMEHHGRPQTPASLPPLDSSTSKPLLIWHQTGCGVFNEMMHTEELALPWISRTNGRSLILHPAWCKRRNMRFSFTRAWFQFSFWNSFIL